MPLGERGGGMGALVPRASHLGSFRVASGTSSNVSNFMTVVAVRHQKEYYLSPGLEREVE